jgi:hypothetical protein
MDRHVEPADLVAAHVDDVAADDSRSYGSGTSDGLRTLGVRSSLHSVRDLGSGGQGGRRL